MPNNRKDEHVALAKTFFQEKKSSDFDDIQFVHHSLSDINLSDVSLITSFGDIKLTNPIYINAMTGGSKKTKQINASLSTIAKETNIAIASGSQSAALNNPDCESSFKVLRKNNPNGILFANIGAERSLEDAKKAIDMIEADALQLHINVPQELIMPEGSRNFSHWLGNIETIVSHVEVPVIAKEVGFGMSRETIQQLTTVGVKVIDIGGKGGTNFIQIENARRKTNDYSYLENWGQSTVVSLLESQVFLGSTSIFASGGIRNPLDMIKSLSLGATATGVAGTILHNFQTYGEENTISLINEWQAELKTIMCLLGKKSISSLKTTDVILSNSLVNWCEARDINWKLFANRSPIK